MTLNAFVVGCSGTELTAGERDFVREARPCGLILFQRNCDSPDQISRLTQEAAAAVGGSTFLVLVDQEGGRVRRMRPPHWRDYPSARAISKLYGQDRKAGLDAARSIARLISQDLVAVGINMNCAPVLDIPVEGAHDIIGDRAYGKDPETVSALGRATADGYLAGGVIPVIKHIPGHGRARADSHEALPVVDTPVAELQASDFAPFAALAGFPAAMTAHILFTAMDQVHPVSVSRTIIGEVIRKLIGFGGLLMSDDLSMKALAGTIDERAKGVIEAGCDIALHCSGLMPEMEAVAGVVPKLDGRSLERFEAALDATAQSPDWDEERALALLDRVMSEFEN